MALVCRAAREEDIAAIASIYAHYVLTSLATFETVPPDCEEMSRRRGDIVARGLPYLVAEWDGAVTGYAYASAYRPRPAYRFTIEDSIYVHPDHLRRGAGRALLGAVIESCERGPWRQMVAVIGDSGNQASIGLHESFGFVRVGVLRSVGFKFGRWVDTVLMQRELGAGDSEPAAAGA